MFLLRKVGKIATTILERNFIDTKINEKWMTDIPEFKLFSEKLYVETMIGLFNGEILAYTIILRITYFFVSKRLEKSFKRLMKKDRYLIHSDQDWYYEMNK
ncbi:hypothetical protein [Bacillus cereus]|uniref:hypothetical protein n=1 Tax=Bacillus cereus TaxID=1396 RepID=UPI0009BF27AD|nr:hypothetical protein [Bacillus cereus]